MCDCELAEKILSGKEWKSKKTHLAVRRPHQPCRWISAKYSAKVQDDKTYLNTTEYLVLKILDIQHVSSTTDKLSAPSKVHRKTQRRSMQWRSYLPDRRRYPRKSKYSVSIHQWKDNRTITCRFFSEAAEAPLLAFPKSDDAYRAKLNIAREKETI